MVEHATMIFPITLVQLLRAIAFNVSVLRLAWEGETHHVILPDRACSLAQTFVRLLGAMAIGTQERLPAEYHLIAHRATAECHSFAAWHKQHLVDD